MDEIVKKKQSDAAEQEPSGDQMTGEDDEPFGFFHEPTQTWVCGIHRIDKEAPPRITEMRDAFPPPEKESNMGKIFKALSIVGIVFTALLDYLIGIFVIAILVGLAIKFLF